RHEARRSPHESSFRRQATTPSRVRADLRVGRCYGRMSIPRSGKSVYPKRPAGWRAGNRNRFSASYPETLERVKGIEPSYAAWEAAVLPLNYTRTDRDSTVFLSGVRSPHAGDERAPPSRWQSYSAARCLVLDCRHKKEAPPAGSSCRTAIATNV